MSDGFKNWSDFYQQINLVFNAIIAISLLPFGWIYLEIEAEGNRTPIMDDNLLLYINILSLILIVSLIYFGYSRAKQQLHLVTGIESLKEKINTYYKVALSKYILLETAAIIAFTVTYIGKNFLFIIVYVFILFLFSFIRPTYDNVVRQLKLSKGEQSILSKGEDLI